MRLPRLRSTLCRCGLTIGFALAASAAWAQLPPPTLRFDPVITDGFYWFNDLYQDPAGFLWAATEGGLFRYDGYTVEGFETAPGDPHALPNNLTLSIATAPDGHLWLASHSQLGRLDPASGTYRAYADEQAQSLTFDGAGAMWYVTAPLERAPWSIQLRTAEGQHKEVAPFGEGTNSQERPTRVSRIVADTAGRIWMPGHALGLARATPHPDGTHALTRWRPADLGADTVMAVRVGSDGSVWVQTDRGFHRHRPEDEGFILVLPSERLPAEARNLRDFLIDRRGLVWIAPAGANGVFVFNPRTGAHTRYTHRTDDPRSLPEARVSQLFEDRGGVLWFGTTDGLYKATAHWGAFHTYPLPTSDLAVTLAADRQHRLWAGSICAPLFAFDPASGAFTPADVQYPGLVAPDCPMRLIEDRRGHLWIGSFPLDSRTEGLFRYDPATETTTVYRYDPEDPTALGSRRIRDLLEDRRGRLWVAGEQGLDRYDPTTDGFTHYRHNPDDEATLAGDVVWSLAEVADGTLWVGAEGLNRLDPETGRITRYLPDPDDPTALPSGAITWIHPSRREPGVLWVSTYDGGLSRFDTATGRVTRYTEADGLPDLYVKAVLEDDRGRIWAPTQEGLARLDPATGEVRTFDEADGLHSRTFGLYDAVTLPDGRFVLAHADALVVFHPDSVEALDTEPPLALSAFRIFDRTVPIASVPDAPLRLRHDENFFSFEFAALDFAAPERTRYAYRLDGFDREWVESETRRYAAYTNLPPGHYTFRVRADTGTGWGAHELAVPLILAPAWWQTAWFRLLAGLGVLGALVGVVRFASTRELRRRLRALEVERRLQAERERISQDLHDHVGAQLSTIVSGIDLMRLSARGDGAPPNHLDRLEAHARRTMTQLRETIWALHREAVTLEEFLARVCAHAREQTVLRSDAPAVACTLDAAPPDAARTLSPAQTLHLYRIAQEAIGNALKHAGATHLDVRLRVEGDTLALEIHDDGCFGAPETNEELNGYGLGGMRRRAAAIDARFELATEDGTRVRIVVPLDESLDAPPP